MKILREIFSPLIAVMAAFIVGGIIILLIVLMAAIGPLAIWLTIWMNRIAFGKYLDKLKRNIEDLENL